MSGFDFDWSPTVQSVVSRGHGCAGWKHLEEALRNPVGSSSRRILSKQGFQSRRLVASGSLEGFPVFARERRHPLTSLASFPYGDWVICLSISRYRAMASDERWGTET